MSEVERLAVSAHGGGAPLRIDRIAGPDRTGTAFAVVDAVGRFVDVSLHPGWWSELGPAGVAAGLLEALATARLKAALVPMILSRVDHVPLPMLVVRQRTPGDDGFLDAARDRIAEAGRLIDAAGPLPPERQFTRVVTGPRGLFRLHLRGGRIDRAEVVAGLTATDADALVADAREALRDAMA
ncbi:hypothetical protein [Paractinoplanes durhamensis]|uniref:hypothetical protein n=1 Tax=Paractinoplanes durhamensis TaxID=113563 RepID=UPI0019407A1E|nr:hypothetical protein [Actinoplanes durhamensis]